MKLVKACIAMAAFAALFVVPSIASASPELCETTGEPLTCHPVPAGTNIIATNVAHAATPSATTMTVTESLKVTCATATMTGKVLKNTGTHIEGEISSASFTGTPGVSPHTTHCDGGSLGATTVTTNPTHNGLSSLPWCITANNLKDEFTVSGKCGTANPVVFQLHFPGFSCTYGKTSLTGTYTTHPADAVLTISQQEVPKVTGGIFCPNAGKLDMAFTLTTDLPGNVEGPALSIT